MVWMGDSRYKLAGALVTLIGQLEAAYPDRAWQTSDGTGTIGDAAHIAEGSSSDHNPWLDNTVRALDVAKTPRGPDCEQLFRMVNRMYGDRDPRVYPKGYAIFNGRITDWNNPGGFHAQVGDPHTEHVHISVGQTGFNDTRPWPLAGAVDPLEEIMGFYADKQEFEDRIVFLAGKGAATRVIDKKDGTVAQYLRKIAAGQDVDKLADELAAALIPKLPAGRGASKADVEAALRAVFADAGTP